MKITSGACARARCARCCIPRCAARAHIVNLLLDLRHHRPARRDRRLCGEICGAAASEGLRHELAMANSPLKLSVVYSWRRRRRRSLRSRTGSGITDNAGRAQLIRPLRCDREDDAAGCSGPAHLSPGIEKPAADPDRQRRADHGPGRSASACDGLGGAGEADREGGGADGEVKGSLVFGAGPVSSADDPARGPRAASAKA